MKILFLGFAVPKAIMDEISRKGRNQPQIAAHKLQWNIINGIEKALGQPIDLISAIATSDYPSFPRIWFGYSKFKHSKDANDVLMPFVNIIVLKHITRFLSSLVLACAWLFKNRQFGSRQILIYAMHSPYVLAAVVATRLLGGKVALIIPDHPRYMNLGIREGLIRRIAKPVDAYFLTKMMRRMAGLVVLTRYMAEDFAPRLPAMVMEGVISSDSVASERDGNAFRTPVGPSERVVAYAGGLAKDYVAVLLDAFALIPDKHYRLWLFGRGAMERKIKEACAQDRRITYWGFLPPDELVPRLRQATVLVQHRRSDAEFVRYSFPSKLLEYMKTGRPVVSTALPGIPDEYYAYLYWLDNEGPEELAKRLREVCSKPIEELNRFGQRGKEFVEREKNYVRQGQRVYEFLKTLWR